MTRAVVAQAPDGLVEVVEIELPHVGTDDVLVRVKAAGVCHSDLSMTNGTLAPEFPVVLGHEAAGLVEEVGGAVSDVAVGDAVILNWSPSCGSCWFCEREQPWLCAAAKGDASRPGGRVGGRQLHAALGIGAFAEHLVVPRSAVVSMPAGLTYDLAALMGCAVLTGVGAVVNTADVRAGDAVAVLGVGGVGLCAIAGARWSCGADHRRRPR